MRLHQVSLAALVAATFAVPSISQGAGGPQYRYTATELLPFTSAARQGSGVAETINNRGVTCGVRVGSPNSLAWCYNAGRLFDLLPLAGDVSSWVNGLNDRGQAVGFSYTFGPNDSRRDRAVVWRNGNVTQLPIDASNSAAIDINNAGHIVGTYDGISFLWKDRALQNLDLYPVAINNRDQIAGLIQVPDPLPLSSSVDHAALREGGVTRDLGTLGGRSSRAEAINDRGQVVGTSDVFLVEGSPHHAFSYDNNGMHDLGGGPNGTSTQARGINNLGQVVGVMEEVRVPGVPPAFEGRAFLWERDTGLQDLTAMLDPAEGWKIVYATSINDQQEIAGFGCKKDLCGPVLLKLSNGAHCKPDSGRAPHAEEPADRRNNNSERHNPNGTSEHGGSVLTIPL